MNAVVYISGPISGRDFEEAFEQFSDAEFAIKEKNPLAKVVNPMRLAIPDGCVWDLAMRECIGAMMECNYIHMLPGFEESKGARLEMTIAQALGFGVCNSEYELEDF